MQTRHQFTSFRLSLSGLQAAHQYFVPIFRYRVEELLLVASVDEEMRMKDLLTFAGDQTHVGVSIRTIIGRALESEVNAIILAHNHPSGRSEPSASDIAFTRAIAMTCEACDIILIDHLIYAAGDVFSFRQKGYLDGKPEEIGDWLRDEDGSEEEQESSAEFSKSGS